jgi:acyl carrier protein
MSAPGTLALELKQLIIEACERPVDPASILDDELLFGPEARLALDSLDALQVSMAIQKRYGLRLTDSKETRRLLSCVANLARVLEAHLASRA